MKGSLPLYTGLIALALLVMFTIFIVIFIYLSAPITSNRIIVRNSGSKDVYVNAVLCDVTTDGENYIYLTPVYLSSGGVANFYASNGANVIIYTEDSPSFNLSGTPSSYARINFRNKLDNQDKTTTTLSGMNSPSISASNYFDQANDEYNVYITNAVSEPITISPVFPYDQNEGVTCSVAGFSGNIDCPKTLLQPTGICASPCFVFGGEYCCTEQGACDLPDGCQSTWLVPEYYTPFHNVCPDCVILNCSSSGKDSKCNINDGFTTYEIDLYTR